MELAGKVKWVVFQFDYFDKTSVRRGSAKNKTSRLELLTIRIVKLVTMPVSFLDEEGTVEVGCFCTDSQLAGL